MRLTDPSGTGVELSWDAACAWVQVHTADLPGGAAQPFHRAGLAVEPMTCPPDAFNTDPARVLLAPGGSRTLTYAIGAGQ